MERLRVGIEYGVQHRSSVESKENLLFNFAGTPSPLEKSAHTRLFESMQIFSQDLLQ